MAKTFDDPDPCIENAALLKKSNCIQNALKISRNWNEKLEASMLVNTENFVYATDKFKKNVQVTAVVAEKQEAGLQDLTKLRTKTESSDDKI
jgi:hypothetical protein